MRGPRIRKIAYVPEAERPVRNDLVRVLTAATASFYPKDARGDAMHAERWRVRIHRTRDLGKLRYTASSVHLANNHPVKWHKDQPKRWPALPAVLTAIRDARHDMAAAWETFFARGMLPESWVGEGVRRFWCDACEGSGDRNGWYNGCTTCENKGATAAPPSLAWAVSLTVRGVEPLVRAELLAREAVARLAPFGVAARERRVVWRVGEVNTSDPPKGWPGGCLGSPDSEAWTDLWQAAVGEGHFAPWWKAHIEMWPKGDAAPLCPHEPAMELLGLGFALDAVDADTIVLVCPLLGGAHG